MYISSIDVRNFRLLQNTKLDLSNSKKQELSLLIGKNNSGKTSFIVLMDKFLRGEHTKFNFNDFSICLRKKIRSVKADPNLDTCKIQMRLEIRYDKSDNLATLSDFILNLKPAEHVVKILFECCIDSHRLCDDLNQIEEKFVVKFIEKNLSDYLHTKIYVYAEETDLTTKTRENLVEKTYRDIDKLINYQVIHAKRNVSSSEFDGRKSVLSDMASSYFNKANLFSKSAFGKINEKILQVDDELNDTYAAHFQEYFKTAKEFVDGGNLNVISNLESRQILDNYARVVYGIDADNYLPESLNGLGHLNILFLLLNIEVKKKFFEQERRDINLLVIEEPEAHTHPQMQYIFAQRIKNILSEIEHLQTFITSHSSHIVSQCDFEDIRYFKIEGDNVRIKNFYSTLENNYKDDQKHFKFLKQFLTLYASELFFAEKIIFIEGVSEKLLFPFFVKQYDDSRKGEAGYVPLRSQNISYMEVGANAKVFQHFIEFLGIKTLIITDIDGCQQTDNDGLWKACETSTSSYTTNVTLKHYYKAPVLPSKKERDDNPEATKEFNEWYEQLKMGRLSTSSLFVKVGYQLMENDYHARSFEDAFFNINMEKIINNISDIHGLQNVAQITSNRADYYNLVQCVLKSDGKSSFASSLLYIALTKDVIWKSPAYIIDGLNWISQ